MSDPAGPLLVAALRGLAAESPDSTKVANRSLALFAIGRQTRRGPWLRPIAALGLAIAAAVSVSYFIPAASEAVANSPFTTWVEHAAGLGDVSNLITGMSDSATQNGITLQLMGGYADSARTVLLVDLPAANVPEVLIGRIYLQDQFGQRYEKRGALQDLSTGHVAIIFEPLRTPATLAGARLTVRIDALETIGHGLVRGPWELHGALVMQSYSRSLSSPQDGVAGGHRVHIASVIAVPHGLRLIVSFPGTAAPDIIARISDGSPKGRPAVILRLVTPSATVAPFMCEYIDRADGPGLDCLWLVPPAVYTLEVDYRGSQFSRQISVPEN